MISFIIGLILLVVGYFLYGRIVERIFGIDPQRKTPAINKQDGIDYIPMKPWKIFLIQFLNIAGVGPIFGAIMGAQFGSASFLWIVFGSIFAGAVHDYIAGMLSLRNDGASLPEIHGKYLGKGIKLFMRGFMVLIMTLVGTVFVSAPADLLAGLTNSNAIYWIIIIFAYYAIATLLPIDKIIGKIYPIFGFCMIFMVFGIMVALFINHPQLPEIWDGLANRRADANISPIFPMMFISIACGAISGFHATQSPMMARCMTNEKQGRSIFYGAMITEGVVALVWAAAATYFFFDPSMDPDIVAQGQGKAAFVVNHVSKQWLGKFGYILALLGVIAAPITSGDTAFRSARLIVADFTNANQKKIINRIWIAIPLFAASILMLIASIADKNGFEIIWRYFAWANQVLAMVTLWAITVYLHQEKKCYFITLIPALFMTMVCFSFIFVAQSMGFGMEPPKAYILGGAVTLVFLIIFIVKGRKGIKN